MNNNKFRAMAVLMVLLIAMLPIANAATLISADEVKEWVGVQATQEYVYTSDDAELEYDGEVVSWTLAVENIAWNDPWMDTESNWEDVDNDIKAFNLGDYDLRCLKITADAANDEYSHTLTNSETVDSDDSFMVVYKPNSGCDDFEIAIVGEDSSGDPIYLSLKAGATDAETNYTSVIGGTAGESYDTIDVPASSTVWNMVQIPIAVIPDNADNTTWLNDGAGSDANFYEGLNYNGTFASITAVKVNLTTSGDVLNILTIRNFEKEVKIGTSVLDNQVNKTYSTPVTAFTINPNTDTIKKCIPTLTTNSFKGTVTAASSAEYTHGVKLTYKLDETPLPTSANDDIETSYTVSGIFIDDLEAVTNYEVMEINVDGINEFVNTNGDVPDELYTYTSGTATAEIELFVSSISLTAQTTLTTILKERITTYKWIGIAAIIFMLWYGLRQYAKTTKSTKDDNPLFRWGLILIVLAMLCYFMGVALAYVSTIALVGAIMSTLAFMQETRKGKRGR